MAYSSSGGIEIVWASKADAWTLSSKVKPRAFVQVPQLCYGDPKGQANNAIIEGDNLHVMASLFKYYGRVDLIYTDPPYNTGSKDFRYNDNWLIDPNDPDPGEIVGSDDGGLHTKWLNFMTLRLMVMKRLLKRGGVIAISIDERELFRLGTLMNAIFQEANRIGIINWQKKYAPSNDSRHLSPATEYVLVYAAWDKECTQTSGLARTERMDAKYRNLGNDPEGLWRSDNLTGADKERHKGLDYGIQSPFTGEMHYPGAQLHWRCPRAKAKKWLEEWGSEYIEAQDPVC